MFKGWKTLTFNVLSVLVVLLTLPEVHEAAPPEWLPWFALAAAGINIGLRMVTTTPVGKGE
jgi:uncharacterized membrane protein AbrB (regulator of aidB expression)